MATIYWLGTAAAVAQIDTVTITADNNDGTTYILTVGSETVSTANTGNTTTTATNLAAAWNASTHPYFTGVTATSDAAVVTLTADTAGVPFTAASSVSGGTGTIGAVTASTASAGPNDWSTAANWSGAAVPVASDIVIIKDNAINICWGLAQSAVDLDGLQIHQSYTGKIGLDYRVFAQSADGITTTTATAVEYRQTYLDIEVDSAAGAVDIGQNFGPSKPAGSARICLDLGVQAANVIIHNTAAAPSESGRCAIRLLADSASTTIHVRSAPGGVGIAVDKPGETATVASVSVSDTSSASRVELGEGTTITTWLQQGGTNIVQAAATITTATINGGVLTTEGSYVITTGNANGGTWHANHISGTVPFTTLNVNGGTVDARGNSEARTWTTVNLKKGTIKADSSILTITTLNEGDSGPYSLALA